MGRSYVLVRLDVQIGDQSGVQGRLVTLAGDQVIGLLSRSVMGQRHLTCGPSSEDLLCRTEGLMRLLLSTEGSCLAGLTSRSDIHRAHFRCLIIVGHEVVLTDDQGSPLSNVGDEALVRGRYSFFLV